MIHQAKSYIKFIRLSKNKHGVHSPFVYNLVTLCFNDKRKYSEYSMLKSFRKALRTDTSLLKMTDFGEGSRIFKGNSRKVSEIAKVAGLTKKRQKLLFRLAAYFECENILEFGTSLGQGSIALALSQKYTLVDTVEGCPATLQKATEYFKKFNLKNITTHQKTFLEFLSENTPKKYDLIFVDGDHNGERTLSYFNSLTENVHNDSVLIFDDIYWSESMTKTWQKIIDHEKVSVSIDTFQWGIVFFRAEQRKQHFVIRI